MALAADSAAYTWIKVEFIGSHILYLVVHPQLKDAGMVGSFGRTNIWCLFSSMTRAGRLVFAHEKRDESGELYRQRVMPVVRAFGREERPG